MDKKTITIIILTVIIILLVGAIFAGRDSAQIALESLRCERDTALESNRIMAIENGRIRDESKELRENYKQLEYQNNEYKQLLDDIRKITEKTKGVINEYGNINNDFAGFLRAATITD